MNSPCIKISKQYGEDVIKILKEAKILNNELKPKIQDNKLLIPVIDVEKSLAIIKGVADIDFCNDTFEEYKFKTKKLNRIIKGISSYTIIGDIAIINYKKDIELLERAAKEIVKINPKIKSVYAKIDTEGEYRVPKLILLYGEKRTITRHKENGLIFYVDIEKTYFNPKLGGEHNRIASLVKENETVLDMFSGVGGFTLNIIKRNKVNVLGVDLNPYAISLASLNYMINKKIFKGDAVFMRANALFLQDIIKNKFDRIIMNHPTGSINFLNVACNLANEKANIHLYTILENKNLKLNDIKDKLKESCDKKYEINQPRRVLEYSPKYSIFEININF
ncbi:class I SAM-dependent methyltransferase [Caldisphaera lagunensis]|uniref:class I SAM-dependent methyltransferase n=1 Tax=Caldisphaera lagunensis TaxID=200415 RepID=UPI0006621EA8|nr:50S ribosomal protein L11 methyltransferase [Caldisphaera lagunensis]